MREYRSDIALRIKARHRRAVRRDNEWCVNHDGVKATHGCRCADCYWVHAEGKNPNRSLMLQHELRRIRLA